MFSICSTASQARLISSRTQPTKRNEGVVLITVASSLGCRGSDPQQTWELSLPEPCGLHVSKWWTRTRGPRSARDSDMKKSTPAPNPEAYLRSLTGWRKTCVEGVRSVAIEAVRMEEVVKWG